MKRYTEIKLTPDVNEYSIINIGSSGEDCVEELVFDMSEYADTYGAGHGSVAITIPGEETPQPAATSQEGNNVHMTITSAITENVGVGQLFLSWLPDDGGVKRTAKILYAVRESYNEGQVPGIMVDWITQAEREKADYIRIGKEFSDKAEEEATKAEEYAANAKTTLDELVVVDEKAREFFSSTMSDIENARDEAIQSITDQTSGSIGEIESATETAKTGAVGAVSAKESEAVANVTNIANAAEAQVNAAKASIETKTNEQLARIPEVTAMKQELEETKSSLSESIAEIFDDLKDTGLKKNVDFSDAIKGTYINYGGSLITSESFAYLTGIKLLKGDVLNISLAGYDTNVALISEQVGDYFRPIVVSDSQIVENHQFVADKEMIIALSYRIALNHEAVIIANVDGITEKINNTIERNKFSYIEEEQTWNFNKYITKEGNVFSFGSEGQFRVSDEIKINPNEQYNIIGSVISQAKLYVIFNANNEVISYFPSDETERKRKYETSFIVPQNASYMRVGSYVDDGKVERILDVPSAAKYEIDKWNNEEKEIELVLSLNKYINQGGAIINFGTEGNSAVSDKILVNENETYKIIGSAQSGAKLYVIFDDKGKVLSYFPTNEPGVKTHYNLTVIMPPNASYIIIGKWYDESTLKYVSNKTETIEEIPVIKQNFRNYEAKTPISSLAMFTDIAVVGDSYTAGQIYTKAGVSQGYFPKVSWGKVMGRLVGSDVEIYARGGATTESALTDSIIIPKALSDSPHQLYILCFGINDTTYVTKGTIDDIHSDYHDNPNTFYGNYGRIIEQLKSHAPNAKIVIVKSWLPVGIDGGNTPYYRYSSEPCEKIAEYYGFPYVETFGNVFLSSEEYRNGKTGAHPTAPLYAGIGKAMVDMLGKCILENHEYFQDFMPV